MRATQASFARLGTALSLLVIAAACGGPQSTLDPAGPNARIAAQLWWAMFAVATIVLIFVVVLWLYALARKSPLDEEQSRRATRRLIIGGGLLLPSVSVAVLLAFGIPAGHRMLTLPFGGEPPLAIEVVARQWWWEVRYPDSGVIVRDALHIPAGRNVDIYVTSQDVIHSFWVPRLGGKVDAVPGRTNVIRLRSDEPGSFRGQCAEFCGLEHARMVMQVHAHTQQGFDAWLAKRAAGSPQ